MTRFTSEPACMRVLARHGISPSIAKSLAREAALC